MASSSGSGASGSTRSPPAPRVFRSFILGRLCVGGVKLVVCNAQSNASATRVAIVLCAVQPAEGCYTTPGRRSGARVLAAALRCCAKNDSWHNDAGLLAGLGEAEVEVHKLVAEHRLGHVLVLLPVDAAHEVALRLQNAVRVAEGPVDPIHGLVTRACRPPICPSPLSVRIVPSPPLAFVILLDVAPQRVVQRVQVDERAAGGVHLQPAARARLATRSVGARDSAPGAGGGTFPVHRGGGLRGGRRRQGRGHGESSRQG